MVCYTSRTYEEQRTIQKRLETGVQAKETADKRMRYNADPARLRIQQSFERRRNECKIRNRLADGGKSEKGPPRRGN